MSRILNASISLATLMLASGSTFAATTAFRSTHIGFTTVSGSAGDQLLLRTGYGTSGAPESEQWAYRFATDGSGQTQLQTRTARFAADPNPPFEQVRFNLFYDAPTHWNAAGGGGISPVNGWYAQSGFSVNPVTERAGFNPTGGDAFVNGPANNPTPLIGGSFAYEIMNVTALNGSPAASFAMSMRQSPPGITDDSQRLFQGVNTVLGVDYDVFGVYDAAFAGGGTLADRSFFLGNGNHFEGWGLYISNLGQYEVTMRIYDINGRYAPSDSFTFQVNSVPAPGALAAMGLGTLLTARRRRS